jgi:dsDNA-specific endonuclease/ATPase MutS2
MKFKSVLDIECGIRYLFSNLEISSSLATRLLLDQEMMLEANHIVSSYSHLQEMRMLVENRDFSKILPAIKVNLSNLKDIRNSLKRLSENVILDDIALFEIKSLTIINTQMSGLLAGFKIKSVCLPDTSGVLNLLDPEGKRITSFYVYDSYSPLLALLRKEYKQNGYKDEELSHKITDEEEKVRQRISEELIKYTGILGETLHSLAYLDILIAKAFQMKSLNLTIPQLSNRGINCFKALFNPEIKEILKKENCEYQHTDIQIKSGKPMLITGSNMGGKTVTLKTLVLSQYLFQFGFGIPAEIAEMTPVSEIFYSGGDGQDYTKGLSSFAAEMKRVDKMIKSIRRGKFVLSLTDEPARTTNPPEGSALTEALITILSEHNILSVLTTHYNIRNDKCMRLRVKGFENGKMNYALIEVSKNDVPHEAIKIAESLGIDQEWIKLAEEELNRGKLNV